MSKCHVMCRLFVAKHTATKLYKTISVISFLTLVESVLISEMSFSSGWNEVFMFLGLDGT